MSACIFDKNRKQKVTDPSQRCRNSNSCQVYVYCGAPQKKNNNLKSSQVNKRIQNKQHRAPARNQLFSRYLQQTSGSQRERLSISKQRQQSIYRRVDVSLVLVICWLRERAHQLRAAWQTGWLFGLSVCLTVVAAARPAERFSCYFWLYDFSLSSRI